MIDGIVGQWSAFAYHCRETLRIAADKMVAPIAVGRDAGENGGLMTDLQRRLHLFGRYSFTMFALSGLDIALWTLPGRLPACRFVG